MLADVVRSIRGGTMNETAALLVYRSNSEMLYVWDARNKGWLKPRGKAHPGYTAVSGGGRGQKLSGITLPYGVGGSRLSTGRFSNMGGQTSAGLTGADTRSFGPIPNGLFQVGAIQQHPKLGQCSELRPIAGAMMGRAGFFIHGQGKTGSEGCIVPVGGTLVEVLQAISELRGLGPVYLRVEGSTTMDFPDLPGTKMA